MCVCVCVHIRKEAGLKMKGKSTPWLFSNGHCWRIIDYHVDNLKCYPHDMLSDFNIPD